ncbi:hypothetical protein [Vulcaniibacterium tengchongense]|uniref:YpeB-like protein with protease inhibitory function n=1 Tax=Vulcaniibacterium tengchongense TaxID=1273429 RepID=A0A3N4VRI6_9GAMM|nr:hypothetical protein [Vulcaniibacterium tengchongense]RPE79677.1 hypothetical protein EDC50_1501 [Vulcaniibacterium tengchongense]
MKIRLRPLLLLLPAVLAAASAGASAQSRGQGRGGEWRGPPVMRAGHARGEEHRALADSVRRIERRTGGQVLSAERVPYDGRDVNRVKVVDSSGRVRIYMDDPQARDRAGDRTRADDD